jgi:small subunit ribosomal protein S2
MKMEVKGENMIEIDVKEMLEAGVHFGHKKDRWNPKMRPFIYTERNGVHIFDLLKTKEALEKALKFVGDISAEGGIVLFVGTKNQVKGIVKEAATNCGMPYLTDRWPGGMLTNFNTILGRLKYLKDAEEKTESGAGMTKKEALNLKRELDKLNSVFEGVKDLRRLPDAVFVADIVKERIAVREAKRLGIPVIGIADSNANPDIEYPIPGNDDAVRAVKFIEEKVAMAIAANKDAKVESKDKEEVEAVEAKTAQETK